MLASVSAFEPVTLSSIEVMTNDSVEHFESIYFVINTFDLNHSRVDVDRIVVELYDSEDITVIVDKILVGRYSAEVSYFGNETDSLIFNILAHQRGKIVNDTVEITIVERDDFTKAFLQFRSDIRSNAVKLQIALSNNLVVLIFAIIAVLFVCKLILNLISR